MATIAESPRVFHASRSLHTALWAVQGLLAALFGAAGLFKLITPISQLAHRLAWTRAVPPPMIRLIGVCELIAAVALIVPSLPRFRRDVLTGFGAAGLVILMFLAAGFHLQRGELQMLPVNAVLGGLAAFVAWGRFSEATLTEPGVSRREPPDALGY